MTSYETVLVDDESFFTLPNVDIKNPRRIKRLNLVQSVLDRLYFDSRIRIKMLAQAGRLRVYIKYQMIQNIFHMHLKIFEREITSGGRYNSISVKHTRIGKSYGT